MIRLVDVSQDLTTGLKRETSATSQLQETIATHVLSSGLLVVHDTGRGGQDDLTERTGGQEQGDPVLDGVQGDVESGRDNTGLVQSAVELDDDLAASVVIDDFKFTDVAFGRETECQSIFPKVGPSKGMWVERHRRVDNRIHPPLARPIAHNVSRPCGLEDAGDRARQTASLEYAETLDG